MPIIRSRTTTYVLFFFFQAEDGIRDYKVTGVQTCALPIFAGDARIAEIGCGTGQMCLYLARADRMVIGADLTRAALRLGAAAARRFGLDRGDRESGV